MHYFNIFDISPKRYLRLLGRNGSEEDRGSAEESEDRPEEVELEDENPWASMTTGLHQWRITEDVHLRMLAQQQQQQQQQQSQQQQQPQQQHAFEPEPEMDPGSRCF